MSEIDDWDREHERQHPEEYYCGFRLLPVICVNLITGATHPAIDVYEAGVGSLCTVRTVEAAKGWIDGQMDVAGRLFNELFE